MSLVLHKRLIYKQGGTAESRFVLERRSGFFIGFGDSVIGNFYKW
jgi:hypothetical protein